MGGIVGDLFGGGGGKQTTQSTTSAPWKDAQPALKLGLKYAQRAFNSDPYGQNSVYTGSTVVPWDRRTTHGMNDVMKNAYANFDGRGLSGQYQGVIDSGGYNDAQLAALNNTREIANSQFNINEDPGFQQVVDQATNAVNSSAAGAGRYGSGTHQGTLGSTIGDLGARQYQNWQGRRDAANANLFNMGQTGLANIGTAYEGLQAPSQSLMQIGAMNEDLATRQMNDRLRVFQAKNDAPWNQVARLNATASGAGQLGGTTTQSAPGQNPFLTALGYGATGAGLLGMF